MPKTAEGREPDEAEAALDTSDVPTAWLVATAGGGPGSAVDGRDLVAGAFGALAPSSPSTSVPTCTSISLRSSQSCSARVEGESAASSSTSFSRRRAAMESLYLQS